MPDNLPLIMSRPLFSCFRQTSIYAAALALACFVARPLSVRAQSGTTTTTYDIYAVRFGVLPQFPLSGLVAGADKDQKLDIPVMVWVLKGSDGRIVLVDSGFHREKFVTRWKVQHFSTPAEAVARLGIQPDQVSDIIITHMHWDHADGQDLFPKATVWIQKDEYEYYTGDAWQDSTRRGGGADPDVMLPLVKRNFAGQLRLVRGDNQTIIPGLTCYTGGRHTYASQYVGVNTAGGTVVLASDNVYLFRNLELHRPIAQTLDAAANLQAQDRMRTLAARTGLVIPGHDPAVFTRFRAVADGVVQIAPDRAGSAR
jgi:glyoxylase-like metal-dependent hydrolase (beta-lactamase superfamily II)